MQYWYCTLAAVATLYSAVHLHVRVQQRLPVASVLEMGKSDGIIIMMMTKSQRLQLWDSEWKVEPIYILAMMMDLHIILISQFLFLCVGLKTLSELL